MLCIRCLLLLAACISVVAYGQQAQNSIVSIESLLRAPDYDQALIHRKGAFHEPPDDSHPSHHSTHSTPLTCTDVSDRRLEIEM